MIRPFVLPSASGGFLALFLVGGPVWAAPGSVSLPGDAAYPESVTATADGTLYAGSFASGGIFRAAPGASTADVWIKPGTFGTRSISASSRTKRPAPSGPVQTTFRPLASPAPAT